MTATAAADTQNTNGASLQDSRISALLIEDDELAGLTTQHFLEARGVPTTWARDGNEGVRAASHRTFDVVLLDLILPDQDGLDVCRSIRERSDVPIIILSARTTEDERISGFDAGADDYVVKPFSPRELASRLLAVVRRVRGHVGPVRVPIVADDLRLEPSTISAFRGGRDMHLTSHEFSLLYALVARRGRIVSRQQLIEAGGGTLEGSIDRSVDVHISRLRTKLGEDARHPSLLKTIRGAGYMFVGRADDGSVEPAVA